ncbi:MAG TPA: hypothetical protein VMZ53_00280 [Kofleriaceae bacterium]|nr:hypothetical protein [Kofleriaceae bacterium]
MHTLARLFVITSDGTRVRYSAPRSNFIARSIAQHHTHLLARDPLLDPSRNITRISSLAIEALSLLRSFDARSTIEKFEALVLAERAKIANPRRETGCEKWRAENAAQRRMRDNERAFLIASD